jgi:hypothetical protein
MSEFVVEVEGILIIISISMQLSFEVKCKETQARSVSTGCEVAPL